MSRDRIQGSEVFSHKKSQNPPADAAAIFRAPIGAWEALVADRFLCFFVAINPLCLGVFVVNS